MKIDTDQTNWPVQLAKAYKKREEVTIVDGAGLGLDPSRQTFYQMGRQAEISARTWVAVLVSLGMSALGARMVMAAILDPEPTSKLGLLVTSGAVLVFCGTFSAIRILTNLKPPSVEASKAGVRIRWR